MSKLGQPPDDNQKPYRKEDEAVRNIEYQVETKAGAKVDNVEVRLHEELVNGDKSAKICSGNGCTNKAEPNDFKHGQFHDEHYVGIGRGSFTVRQQFFVDGGQVQIHFGDSVHWSQTVAISQEQIVIRPDPTPH